MQNFNISVNNVFYWSDSQIVLAWLQTEPSNLKIFVAHRVAEIQTLTDIENWHYIPTSDNPADILSRGTTVQNLTQSKLW